LAHIHNYLTSTKKVAGEYNSTNNNTTSACWISTTLFSMSITIVVDFDYRNGNINNSNNNLSFKNDTLVERTDGWKEKALHGQYIRKGRT